MVCGFFTNAIIHRACGKTTCFWEPSWTTLLTWTLRGAGFQLGETSTDHTYIPSLVREAIEMDRVYILSLAHAERKTDVPS